MKPNMGNFDRIIRVVIAAVIAILYFGGIIEGTLGMVLIVLAAIFVATSLIKTCPLYIPFKINTGAKPEEKK